MKLYIAKRIKNSTTQPEQQLCSQNQPKKKKKRDEGSKTKTIEIRIINIYIYTHKNTLRLLLKRNNNPEVKIRHYETIYSTAPLLTLTRQKQSETKAFFNLFPS